MELKLIDEKFSICKLSDTTGVDISKENTFLSVTDEEISLVCISENLPGNLIEVEHGWKAFKMVGILDFSLVGILAEISNILADNGINIFVISTFNTDYILIKADRLEDAIYSLEGKGYIIS